MSDSSKILLILLELILILDVEGGSKSAERNITATVGLVVHAAGKDQHVTTAQKQLLIALCKVGCCRLKPFQNVRFEVLMAVTMKNAIFWDVMLCSSCKNQRFGGT
jgi:hypothetical protein